MHNVSLGAPQYSLPVLRRRLDAIATQIQQVQEARNKIIALNVFQNLEITNYNLKTKYQIPRDFFTRQIDEIKKGTWQEKIIAIVVVSLSIVFLVGIVFVVNGISKSAKYQQLEKELSDIQKSEGNLLLTQKRLQKIESSMHRSVHTPKPTVKITSDETASSHHSEEHHVEEGSSRASSSPRGVLNHLLAFVTKHSVIRIDTKEGGKWSESEMPNLITWLKKPFFIRPDRKDMQMVNFLVMGKSSTEVTGMVMGIKGIQKAMDHEKERTFLFIVVPSHRNENIYSLQIYDMTDLRADTDTTTLKAIEESFLEEDEIMKKLNELLDGGILVQGKLVECKKDTPRDAPSTASSDGSAK